MVETDSCLATIGRRLWVGLDGRRREFYWDVRGRHRRERRRDQLARIAI